MKKSKTPHAVLGVPPDASADEVRKAYRKKARQHHPDRGGDPEKFREVQHALKQITNSTPDDGTPEDKQLHATLLVLGQAYQAVLVDMIKAGRQPEQEDIVRGMRRALDAGRDSYKAALAEVTKIEKLVNRSIKRFKRKDKREDQNFMHNVLEHHLDSLGHQRREIEQGLVTNAECYKMLDELIYEVDKQPEPQFMSREWSIARGRFTMG